MEERGVLRVLAASNTPASRTYLWITSLHVVRGARRCLRRRVKQRDYIVLVYIVDAHRVEIGRLCVRVADNLLAALFTVIRIRVRGT